MEENQRVKKLINCLKEKKIIHNQNHFVELIGSDKATISLIVNNKEINMYFFFFYFIFCYF